MASAVLKFGDYTLHGATGELHCAGVPIDVQPKVLAVLQYLVDRRDSVVSKEELLAALWPNEVVSEGVLKRAVHALRVAVGDDGSKQAVIRTLPRRGYRFVAPLRVRPAPVKLDAERSTKSHSHFIGRGLPLGQLRSAWARARSGRGAVVLVAGPPGIGKTRLVDELADQAVAEGGRLLRGWCDESRGAPPYWPWIQIVRRLGGDSSDQLGADRAGENLEPPSAESHERAARSVFARQQVISEALLVAAQQAPVVIVVEDLHWADRATLGALAFVAREIADRKILVLGTFRDDELSPENPVVQLLRQLMPRASDFRIHLDGLTQGEVHAMTVDLAGRETSSAAAEAIHERTAGNPLFVHEVVRTLLATDSLHDAARSGHGWRDLPLGAIGVLDRRLGQLSDSSRMILECAAVIGSVFDRDLLHSLCGEDLGFIADALDAAQLMGVVRASRDDPTEWEFGHSLLREALLGSIQASRRLEIHRDFLAELEARHRPDPGSALARLAEHANAICQAGGDARTALGYDRLAAWHAAARYAFDDCAAHADRALETLRTIEVREGVDVTLAIEVRIDRARAANMQRDPETALTNAEAAAKLACEANELDALARAALSIYVHPPADQALIRRNIRLIELAEANVDRESVMWVRLVSARVMQLAAVADTGDRRKRDSAEALERARALGDQDALVRALSADLTSNWSQHDPTIRLEYAHDLHRGVAGMPDRFVDSVTLLTALVEQGDLDAWQELIRGMQARIATARADRYYAYYEPLYAATRALWEGQLQRAERLMQEAHEATQDAGPLWGARAFATQLFQLRIDQGRGFELEAGIRAMHRQFPADYSFPVVLAYMLCEENRFDEARPIFEAAVDDYHVGSDVNASVTLTVMATVCAALGDRCRAERLYSQLLPLREIVAVNLGCWICQGSVQWPLGLLAWTMGDLVRGERHLEEALARNHLLGMRTYEARAGLDLARLLTESGRTDRVERARAALADALLLAGTIDMPAVVARGEALKAALAR